MSDHPLDDVPDGGLAGGALSVDSDLRPDTGDAAALREWLPSGARLAWAGFGILPWIVALGVATLVLLQTGTPGLDIARYSVYWCLGVTLPGVLVARAVVGTRGN